MEEKFDIIMPVTADNVKFINRFQKYLFQFLPTQKLILIGDNKVKLEIDKLCLEKIEFIDENSLISITDIEQIIAEITEDDPDSVKRSGWYLQQFLKMKYSQICKKQYYIIWDSDTIPTKPIILQNKEHPIFDMKDEHMQIYFDTIYKLLGIEKMNKESFISEHMIVSCKLMKELIVKIEENNKYGGTHFYHKILYAIDKREIKNSGFSEFETYGTFVTKLHPEIYCFRKWESLRDKMSYFNIDEFGDSELRWISKKFSAISFEKWAPLIKGYHLFHNTIIHKLLPFNFLRKLYIGYTYILSLPEKIKIRLKINEK